MNTSTEEGSVKHKQTQCTVIWTGLLTEAQDLGDMAQHSTAQHSTAQHSTAPLSTVQLSTAKCDTNENWKHKTTAAYNSTA